MKNPIFNKNLRGFTLVELLVVIAIIATLAATSFTIGPAMINKARKVSALASATGITNAVEQFYSEYSALPDPAASPGSTDETIETNTAQGATLLNILSGIGGNSQNPRGIRFLTAKEAKNNRDGVVYAAGGAGAASNIEQMFDPWGQPYFVRLDFDYDEQLTFVPRSGIPSVTLNQKRVAVYSLGVEVPAEADPTTLVKTW